METLGHWVKVDGIKLSKPLLGFNEGNGDHLNCFRVFCLLFIYVHLSSVCRFPKFTIFSNLIRSYIFMYRLVFDPKDGHSSCNMNMFHKGNVRHRGFDLKKLFWFYVKEK